MSLERDSASKRVAHPAEGRLDGGLLFGCDSLATQAPAMVIPSMRSVGDAIELIIDRLIDLFIAVAEAVDRRPAGAVNVALARCIVEVRALAPGDPGQSRGGDACRNRVASRTRLGRPAVFPRRRCEFRAEGMIEVREIVEAARERDLGYPPIGRP